MAYIRNTFSTTTKGLEYMQAPERFSSDNLTILETKIIVLVATHAPISMLDLYDLIRRDTIALKTPFISHTVVIKLCDTLAKLGYLEYTDCTEISIRILPHGKTRQ